MTEGADEARGGAEAEPGAGRGAARIGEAERVELMRRLDAGESQSALAREFGCSRQYISQLRKRFEKFGEAGIAQRPRGRPKVRPLTAALRKAIREAIDGSRPSEHGIAPHFEAGDAWHIDAVREWIKDREGWTPSRGQVIGLFEEWQLPRTFFRTRFRGDELDEPDAEFLAWLDSPIARQIREREEEMARRIEAEAAAEPPVPDRPRRRGRPPGSGRKQGGAGTPKGGPADAGGAGPGGDASLSPADEADDSFDALDADFEAFRREFEAGRIRHPAAPAKAGVRTGKHAKASAGGKAGGKKRRRRKGRRR